MRKIIAFAVISILILESFAGAKGLSRSEFIEEVNTLFLKEDYTALIKKSESEIGRLRFTGKQKKEVFYLMGLSYIKLDNFVKV